MISLLSHTIRTTINFEFDAVKQHPLRTIAYPGYGKLILLTPLLAEHSCGANTRTAQTLERRKHSCGAMKIQTDGTFTWAALSRCLRANLFFGRTFDLIS